MAAVSEDSSVSERLSQATVVIDFAFQSRILPRIAHSRPTQGLRAVIRQHTVYERSLQSSLAMASPDGSTPTTLRVSDAGLIESTLQHRRDDETPAVDESIVVPLTSVDSPISAMSASQGKSQEIKLGKLLNETKRVDYLLRRALRKRAYSSWLDGIDYATHPGLMAEMGTVLAEYESLSADASSEVGSVWSESRWLFDWKNAVNESLSTVVSRMLCLFIDVRLNSGDEAKTGLDMISKFDFIIDVGWAIKLANQHRLESLLRQLMKLRHKREVKLHGHSMDPSSNASIWLRYHHVLDQLHSEQKFGEMAKILCSGVFAISLDDSHGAFSKGSTGLSSSSSSSITSMEHAWFSDPWYHAAPVSVKGLFFKVY